MTYGKAELQHTLEQILDAEQVKAIGITRAVEEAAYIQGLNDTQISLNK